MLTPSQLKIMSVLLGRNSDDRDLQSALAELWLDIVGADRSSLGEGRLPTDIYQSLRQRWEARKALPAADTVQDADVWRDIDLLRNLEIARRVDGRSPLRREATLESQGREAGIYDTVVWISKLAEVHQRVCVVESRKDGRVEQLGTGFLVADDQVLTAHHVVKEVIASAVPNGSVRCVFDRNAGTRESVHELADRRKHFYVAGPDREMEGGAQEPAPHELDFALLRLATPAGRDVLGRSVRGFISVVEERAECKGGEHIFVIQHPGGSLQKIAFGTVAEKPYNDNGTRLRYVAETDGGSSGAPCLTSNLDLVAIHQARRGETASGRQLKQGVPIAPVLRRIARESSVQNFWELRTRSARPIEVVVSPGDRASAMNHWQWSGRTVRDDAITVFCRTVVQQYNVAAGGDAAFTDYDDYAGYIAPYGSLFWMSDRAHQLNEHTPDDPDFYYEIWFKERERAPCNICDISLVWHRQGERARRGNRGIAERMETLARMAQEELAPDLEAQRLAFARIDETEGSLVVGIRRRLWNEPAPWALETAVDSVKKNIMYLRQHIEGRLERIIESLPSRAARSRKKR